MAPTSALACGLPLGAVIDAERALLVVNGSRQALIASVDLSDTEPDAAVIFPVPGVPTVDQPAGGENLFAYLDEATRPLIRREQRLVWGRDQGETVGGAPPGVSLLGREQLGAYDVARLAADDAGALQGWLAENGYSLPTAAEPILAAYIAEEWSFVAVRLAENAPDGSLAPLRMSYDAPELVYPLRLGALSDRPVAMDLYILADRRMSVDGLETVFAGLAAGLEPAPPAELAPLLADAPFLTRLRSSGIDPAGITGDLTATPAPNDQPFRAEQVVYENIYLFSGAPLLFLVICLSVLFSSLAVTVSIIVRKRIDTLG